MTWQNTTQERARAAGRVMAACLAAVLLAACGGGAATPDAPTDALDSAGFKQGLDHPYIPTTPGLVRIYDGDSEGQHRHEEVEALQEPRIILGIACTPIQQVISVGGVVTEVTTEWFAQDLRGNIWKFGEHSLEKESDFVRISEDSWVAGERDGRPWIMFAASPAVGDAYVGFRPDGQDEMHVTSLSETADVPAGRFSGCMRIVENPADPNDKDIILYAPGMGRVSEDSSTGRIELTATEQR